MESIFVVVWLYWFLLRPRLRRIEKALGLDHNKSCNEIMEELDNE
jgi:hypothetical protein